MDAEGKAQPPSEGAELVAEAEQLVERCRNVSNRAATFQDKQQQELDLICGEWISLRPLSGPLLTRALELWNLNFPRTSLRPCTHPLRGIGSR